MENLIKAIKEHSGMTDSEIMQAGEHGADTGWSGFTYTGDCVDFYDQYKDLIWELLRDTADQMGQNAIELISSFNRQDMLEGFYNGDQDEQFKNLLAWFALEEAGRYLECNQVES